MGNAGSKPAAPPPLPKRDMQRVEILEIPSLDSPSVNKPGYSIHMSEYQRLCDGYMKDIGDTPRTQVPPDQKPIETPSKVAPPVTMRAVPEGPFYPPKPNKRHMSYVVGNVIGQGSYGKVYLATEQLTGQMLAVKQISIGSCSAETLQSLDAETRLLCNLQHPNLVKVYDVEVDRDAGVLSLVMEYVPGGNLATLTKQLGGIPELLCRRYVRQLVDVLAYMHLHRVAHLDLKCSNIMLGGDGTLKLVDFGSATRLCRAELGDDFDTLDASTGQVHDPSARVRIGMKGSPYWVAPECVRYPVYDVFKADVWSLGCMIIEMLDSYPPFFQFKQIPVLLYHIATLADPPPLPSMISSVAGDFLHRCLCVDPKARASIFELAQHPWIADINLGLGLMPLHPYTRREYYREPRGPGLEPLPEEDSGSAGEAGAASTAPRVQKEKADASHRVISRSPAQRDRGENANSTGHPRQVGELSPLSRVSSGAEGQAPTTVLPDPRPRAELAEGRIEDDPVAMAVLAETATGGGLDGPMSQLLRRGGEGPPISSFQLTASVLFDVLLEGHQGKGIPGCLPGGIAGGMIGRTLSAKRLWMRASFPMGSGDEAGINIEELDGALFLYDSSDDEGEAGEQNEPHSARDRGAKHSGYDRDTRVFGDLTEPEWLIRAHDELFSTTEKAWGT